MKTAIRYIGLALIGVAGWLLMDALYQINLTLFYAVFSYTVGSVLYSFGKAKR